MERHQAGLGGAMLEAAVETLHKPDGQRPGWLRRQLQRLRPTTSIDGLPNEHALRALAILLLLAQLPHILHLPIWVSALGAFVIGARLWVSTPPPVPGAHRVLRSTLSVTLSPIPLTVLAMLSAGLIKLQFGYLLGRDPGVAFLFLLVAFKFGEFRRTGDATTLLCLAAFLLLTQYFYSQTILSALITLPAVIALGYALAVLREPDSTRAVSEHLKLVGKILLQGVPLAALLFVVFPRLPGPLWSMPDDGTAQTGLSDSMEPGSIGELSKSDAVAFRVDFNGAVPDARDRYWRGPVLSEFDGKRWSLGPKQLQNSVPQATGERIDYTVMLQPHQQRWLFALDMPAGLPRAGNNGNGFSRALARMTADGQLISKDPVVKVMRYRQQSTLLERHSPTQTPSPVMLQLANNHPRTTRFARQLRGQSSNEADYAQRVLNWFTREPFYYTLRPDLLGRNPIDEFLFDTRRGFCEHYASSFVILMRSVGIPARVVTGYLGGEINDDYMIVRQSDAHAWAEAWIDGAWQRFDPTGAVAPSRIESGMASALPSDDPIPRLARLDASWLKSAQLSWDALNHDWQRLIVDFNDDSQTQLWKKLGLGTPQLWQLMLLLISAAGIWGIAVLGLPQWRNRHLPLAERQWRYLKRSLRQRGVPLLDSNTPAEVERLAVNHLPEFTERLQLCCQTLSRLRFEALDEDDTNRLQRRLSSPLRRLHIRLLLQRLTRRMQRTHTRRNQFRASS